MMKKFWIVLLALGLVAGFAMSASAADVKFSGSYYVAGIYIDNPQLLKSENRTYGAQSFYHQRLRLQTEFKVAEGLVLVTRIDALEKAWGYGAAGITNDAWRGHPQTDVVNRPASGGNTATGATVAGAAISFPREQENIEFERVYMDFTTKVGRFMIGYQNWLAFGTGFLDTHLSRPGIKYLAAFGPITLIAGLEKVVEQNAGGTTGSATTYVDADGNVYDLGFVYKFGAGDAGMMYQYADSRGYSTNAAITAPAAAATGYKRTLHVFNPYAKAKFGPVYIEAEGVYGFGKWQDPVGASVAANIDGTAWGLYLHAKADIGPAYVGGIFAVMSGDDPATTDKREGTVAGAAGFMAGQAWDPCLILWNDGIYGAQHRIATPGGIGVFFDNAWLYQIHAGFKPVKEADIMLSVTYAYADQKAAVTSIGKEYGWEVDLTAKYKIFDNLEYMIGAGYLVAGDYFKGIVATTPIDNNYMLFHRMTLSF
jgi:hypothetical protein